MLRSRQTVSYADDGELFPFEFVILGTPLSLHAGTDVSGKIAEIARRFERQPGWRFTVTFGGNDAQLPPVPRDAVEKIRTAAAGVEKMLADGHDAAALVMAFSLLEATTRATRGQSSPPLKPGTVVQTLAMDGLIDPDLAMRLRELVGTRNSVVHGNTSAHVTQEDVRAVLSAVEGALTAAFAG